jgi:hypothetical protein
MSEKLDELIQNMRESSDAAFLPLEKWKGASWDGTILDESGLVTKESIERWKKGS